MTALRNKSLRMQVLARDLGLCRCCGFVADEVHHIIPVVYGGLDDVKNMVAVCHTCHQDAPDTKAEFIDYMNCGGNKLKLLYGQVVHYCFKAEKQGANFQEMIIVGIKMIQWLREFEYNRAIENKNIKEALTIPNIDLNLNDKENNNIPLGNNI